MTNRLDAQVSFLKEADRLKSVNRANLLLDGSRPENSAEHSWHLALYAWTLAPLAGPDVNMFRVLHMLLLHDLVEVDAGDHPIHETHDWAEVERRELLAAQRIFGLLPDDQGQRLHDLWLEFEADTSPDARFAKQLDRCQPIFQTLCAAAPVPEHVEIVRDNMKGGRAAYLEHAFPPAYAKAHVLLGFDTETDTAPISTRLPFLTETDKLKSVLRASRLADNSRRENSAEHSWHVMLHALILAEHAAPEIDLDRVLEMLLLHDIVEIDAGDNPIHGQVNQVEMEAKEQAASKRLFGLLPPPQQQRGMAIWTEFEAAATPEAQFAKAIDRLQVPILNLANGGGTWREYEVTLPQLEQRVGVPIRKGAPALWDWLFPHLETAFARH
ncbi:MAG: HD domain-containing protein [Rhodobacteraceae bacterium]|nr:HD domain-containing protein [Paracoccaceae bacterium]